jgi:phosphofructokinase-like protein
MSKIAMLTGGGDCPGLNAVIAGATRTLEDAGLDAVGLVDGWRGAVEGLTMDLSPDSTANIIGVGGTILGSSRTNPYKIDGGVDKIKASFEKLSIDALIAIGGDDTLGVATRLFEEDQMHVIGVPKTIDNDLSATDFTFGFDTAVNIAMDAVDRIRTTARSHHRVLVIETMGRHAGWIAAYTGICGNADVTLVPEMKVDIEAVCCTLKRKREKGQHYNLVVVSEGATFQEGDFLTQDTELDAFGHVRLGGVAEALADIIEKKTGFETRHVVLGHLQRGGAPTSFDRMLGTRLGVKAAQAVLAGDWGKMAAMRGSEIVTVPLTEATGELKILNDEFKELVRLFSS